MRLRLFLSILVVAICQSGCLYAARYDGPYRGKVVDQETNQPIEGVVVLGRWGNYHFCLAGGYSTFYDAREAETDKNGEFVIPGQGPLIMTNVGPMGALIYKAGYTYYQTGAWDTLKTASYRKEEVKWEGDIPVFGLRKLSDDERRKDRGGRFMPSVGMDPSKLMSEEINKERVFRGLNPL